MVVSIAPQRPTHRLRGRGLRVLVVVDRAVAPDDAARSVAARLADELPPQAVTVVARTPHAWHHLLGLDPTLVCVETALSYEPLVAAALPSPVGVDAGSVRDCFAAAGGLTTSARWSRRGWRATLRRARAEQADTDLVLAVTRRPRRLPAIDGAGRFERLVLSGGGTGLDAAG